MKNMIKNHNIKEVYQLLHHNKKKMLVKTILFALLLLGINTYAWFIFFDKFDGNINANVIGWDVTFYDDDTSMENVSLDINSLYPGMDTYVKEIRINNSSDVRAKFDYEINSFTLFGREYLVTEERSSEMLIQTLETEFPFSIKFTKTKEELNSGGDSSIFTITVAWPFESEEDYYKLNEYFVYDSSLDYYTYLNEVYMKDNFVDAGNLSSKIKSGLYLKSDDGDSFWGKQSSVYKKNNPDSSGLKLNMKLIVQQIQSN